MWTLSTSGGVADATSRASSATPARSRSPPSERTDPACCTCARPRERSTASPRASRGARLRRRAGARRRCRDVRRRGDRARRHGERAAERRALPRQAHGAHRPERRMRRALRTFGPRTPEGVTRVFLVRRRVVDASCAAAWYQVDLPIRPNGVRGWVPRGRPASVRRALAPAHRARPAPADRLRGRPRAAAPDGRDRPRRHADADGLLLRVRAALPDAIRAGPYGPGALGLSSFSPVLTGWTRGGPVAIHGTTRRAPSAAPSRTAASACATSRCGGCCATSRRARRSRSSPEPAGPRRGTRRRSACGAISNVAGVVPGSSPSSSSGSGRVGLDVHAPRAQHRHLAVPEVRAAVEAREVEREVELADVAPDEHVEQAVVGLGLRADA